MAHLKVNAELVVNHMQGPKDHFRMRFSFSLSAFLPWTALALKPNSYPSTQPKPANSNLQP